MEFLCDHWSHLEIKVQDSEIKEALPQLFLNEYVPELKQKRLSPVFLVPLCAIDAIESAVLDGP